MIIGNSEWPHELRHRLHLANQERKLKLLKDQIMLAILESKSEDSKLPYPPSTAQIRERIKFEDKAPLDKDILFYQALAELELRQGLIKSIEVIKYLTVYCITPSNI